MKSKTGFTLIEIMVSLVLVGLIASVAGTSVLMGIRGYVFARENDAITQKAQLALNRFNREFIELMDIRAVNASPPYVIYKAPLRTGGVEWRAIAKVGNTVQMFFQVPGINLSGLTGDTLIDGVQNFSILYNGATTVPGDIHQLYAIGIQMELIRPDTGGTVSFSTTVSPRNNDNAGGAPVPTALTPPPEYSGRQCFVTTAAWGDPDHPVVEVLRQFRDRVLLHSAVGKAMIRYYYDVGPSLAAAIEDKPLACLIVRLLVLPVAGLALLALSCPILIPLILLLSWGIAGFILRELRRRSLRWAPRLRGQRGAMLVTLIATMVVFSALGAIMVGMFGTSALSQVSGNNSLRAYYLAESGFRYAASAYVNVAGANEAAREAARDDLMVNQLNGKTFSLGTDGSFSLGLYPFFFKVTKTPTQAERLLYMKATGSFPLSDPSQLYGGWVKVTYSGGTKSIYTQVGTVGWDSSGIWFSFIWVTEATNIEENSVVTPACVPDTSMNGRKLIGPDINGYYDLAIKPNTGIKAFPEKNGIFMVQFDDPANPSVPIKKILSYTQRDLANNRLKGISDPDGGGIPTGTMKDSGPDPSPGLPYQNYIELTKFIRLESTGTYGQGSAAVNRKATFFVPVGSAKATPIAKTEFKETFDDATLANWFTGSHASHIGAQAQSSSIGPALQFGAGAVTRGAAGTSYSEGQIGLNWTAANIPLVSEWNRASNYLSYDAQAKIYFYVPSVKHAAGLTFRLDESGNAMGLSYGVLQQGVDQYNRDQDNIPDQIVSSASVDTPVITLWTKQYNKADTAFTVVSNPNPGPAECTGHPPTTTGHFAISSTNSAVWETGNRVRFVPSGGATLPGGVQENTDYYARKIAETNYFYLFDSSYHAYAKDNGNPRCWLWDGIRDITGAGSGTVAAVNQDPAWTNLAYQNLTTSNRQYGVYSTSLGSLIPWSTFLVRLIEAPSVSVLSTAGSTGWEIVSGDTVYTTSDNSSSGSVTAIALVRRNPVYRSDSPTIRDWSGKTAQAVLILEPIKDSITGIARPHVFGQGKTLYAGEPPGGVNAGQVNTPAGSTDIVYRDRDQWIAVYVGDPNYVTRTPDSDPFNIVNTGNEIARGRILRTSVRWPEDDVEKTNAANDYFTIVRFASFVNSTSLCRVNGLDMSGTNCLAGFYSTNNTGMTPVAPDILRFSSPDGVVFNSPSTGTIPPARAEVGLHTFGSPIMSFDDFAIQFGPGYGITRQGFLLPIQQ